MELVVHEDYLDEGIFDCGWVLVLLTIINMLSTMYPQKWGYPRCLYIVDILK